jgi:hypothetical protein
VDEAGHDADLAFARGNDAGAVGSDEFGAVGAQRALTLSMSSTGMPSVMQTMTFTPASAASMMPSAAKPGGT